MFKYDLFSPATNDCEADEVVEYNPLSSLRKGCEAVDAAEYDLRYYQLRSIQGRM